MNEDLIRKTIEEVDPESKISQSIIEELVMALKDEKDFDKTQNVGTTGFDLISVLQDKLRGESDWRKRAAIAARIVGLGLST
jgi:hypothetical protein